METYRHMQHAFSYHMRPVCEGNAQFDCSCSRENVNCKGQGRNIHIIYRYASHPSTWNNNFVIFVN